jgi:7-cyano-7-deazaguanine synthase
MKALLLSGGLDSSALAWWYRPDICVTVNYGQRSAGGEIAASVGIAAELLIRHELIAVDLQELGSGMLSRKSAITAAKAPEFWPYRNQMLVTLTAMKLVGEGLSEIMIGAVSTDIHADGRGPFLNGLDKLMRCQEGAVRVTAPARHMTSLELFKRSGFPRSLLGLTFSCHAAEYACGQCRGCVKHREVVEQCFGPQFEFHKAPVEGIARSVR